MSDELSKTGALVEYKVLGAKIDALTKTVETGLKQLERTLAEHKEQDRDQQRQIDELCTRLGAVERQLAKAEGSDYDRRLSAQARKLEVLSKRVWLMSGAALAGGGAIGAALRGVGGG